MADSVWSIGFPLEDESSNRVKSQRIANKKLKLVVQLREHFQAENGTAAKTRKAFI